MRYDLTSLKLFVAVAECGNLTRAAEREHLAVSAISKRIAELEDIVRTPLLQRQPRGVTLTPAGQSLLHHARQMLQLMQRMDVELGEYAAGVKGHVRLYAVASALTQFLPEELESFLGRYPLVNIALEEHTGKAVVLGVASGAAEIGVIASQTPAAGLATFPYHADRLVIGVPNGHPLARRKAITFSEAAQHAFVGPHAESSLSALLADAARSVGVTLQQRVQASSFDAMCRLVETRLGITMLPEGVLEPHAAAGRLVVVSLKEPWAVRQMQLIVRDPEQLSPIARTLLDHLRQSATQNAP